MVARLGLDPERVHAIHLGVDHERFSPDASVAREPFLLYPARPWPHKNHARLSRRSRACAPSAPSCASCSRASGTTRRVFPRESRRAAAFRRTSSSRSIAAPPRSSSRASTRALGCLPSRRWPAAARSPRPTPGRCRRWSATRRSSSIRASRRRSPPVSRRRSTARDELRGRGLARAAGFTWDATARAHDRVYEAAFSAS